MSQRHNTVSFMLAPGECVDMDYRMLLLRGYHIAARCRTPGHQITAFHILWVFRVLVQQQLQLSGPVLGTTRRFSRCRRSQSAQLAATTIAAPISPSLAQAPASFISPC